LSTPLLVRGEKEAWSAFADLYIQRRDETELIASAIVRATRVYSQTTSDSTTTSLHAFGSCFLSYSSCCTFTQRNIVNFISLFLCLRTFRFISLAVVVIRGFGLRQKVANTKEDIQSRVQHHNIVCKRVRLIRAYVSSVAWPRFHEHWFPHSSL